MNKIKIITQSVPAISIDLDFCQTLKSSWI